MIDRRTLLIAGAGLAACTTPSAEVASATGDSDFRSLVERLAQADRPTVAAELAAFDARRLSAAGRILYEAVLPGAQADAALAALSWGQNGQPYAVSHRYGAYRSANADPAAIDRETEQLNADAALGVIAPDFVLDATLAAVGAVERRADGAIAAALRRQIAALTPLRARAGSEAGVMHLPDGERFYQLTLRVNCGGRAEAGDVHLLAREQCDALRAEAERLLRAQGLQGSFFGLGVRTLARDERYLYADSAEGKALAVSDMNAALARVRPLLRDMIDGADTPAEVRLVPPDAEADGAAGRREGSVYFVDLGAIRTRPRWSLPSVAYHELVPGHILQAAFGPATPPPALQTRYASGYSEGWAIYAEQLADEAGAYADDPLSRIGYLQWMLFRMARVLADTGMHALGWSRARAMQEMRALQGDSIAFVSIEEDVTRIAAQPGVYAAQGVTALAIAQIREMTRRHPNFSPRRFHAAMLRHGPLSPPGLSQAMNAALT